MAKTWYAVTQIQGGVLQDADDNDSKVTPANFKPGEKVTGLDVDTMKSLYKNGAISSTRPDWVEEEEEETEPSDEDAAAAKVPPKKVVPTKAPAQQ